MTTRRSGRSYQVRPRPPSTGRPAPVKPRPRTQVMTRLSTPKRGARRRGLPLAIRLILGATVVLLGAVALTAAGGGLGRLAGIVGGSVDAFIDDLTATPSPSPTEAIVSDSPLIAGPADGEPYTNVPNVDLVLTIPSDVVGAEDTFVRVYLALPDQSPAPITQIPVGASNQLIVPVTLTEGGNNFTATLLGPGGESEPSPVVTWILDTVPPEIALASPANGATVNRQAVDLAGSTQPRSTLVARNEANSGSTTGIAGADGSFTMALPLQPGTNGISITATDPAGNSSTVVISVLRGSGVLTAVLTSSTFRISVASLPAAVELSVLVTDPDGRPLEGAAVTFTLSIPGVQVVASDAVTAGDGRAVFRTTVPPGATPGSGLGTVLVTTPEFGTTSDRTVINVVQ